MSEIINFINLIRSDKLKRSEIENMVLDEYHTDISIDHWWRDVMQAWSDIDKQYWWGSWKDIWDYALDKNWLLILTDWESELIQNDQNMVEYIERESLERLYSDRQSEVDDLVDNPYNDADLTSYDK